MELIKEIAHEKLVLMVTHNPELAEKYSTRIIKLLDGKTIDDTNPYSLTEEKEEHKAEETLPATADDGREPSDKKPESTPRAGKRKADKRTRQRKSQNVLRHRVQAVGTKSVYKKRAHGHDKHWPSHRHNSVSLVLAISYGVQSYIRTMQNDMLSGNPITIEETTFDMSALMSSMTPSEKSELIVENGFVNVNSLIDSLVKRSGTADNLVITNNITQDYVDFVKALPREDAAAIHLDYGLDAGNNIYTDFKAEHDGQAQNMSLTAIRTIYTAVLKETKFAQYAHT